MVWPSLPRGTVAVGFPFILAANGPSIRSGSPDAQAGEQAGSGILHTDAGRFGPPARDLMSRAGSLDDGAHRRA